MNSETNDFIEGIDEVPRRTKKSKRQILYERHKQQQQTADEPDDEVIEDEPVGDDVEAEQSLEIPELDEVNKEAVAGVEFGIPKKERFLKQGDFVMSAIRFLGDPIVWHETSPWAVKLFDSYKWMADNLNTAMIKLDGEPAHVIRAEYATPQVIGTIANIRKKQTIDKYDSELERKGLILKGQSRPIGGKPQNIILVFYKSNSSRRRPTDEEWEEIADWARHRHYRETIEKPYEAIESALNTRDAVCV